jgi:hypothetical protein
VPCSGFSLSHSPELDMAEIVVFGAAYEFIGRREYFPWEERQ